MYKFYELYKSFDEFYASFFRGNEIQFLYKSVKYYILPIYRGINEITGVCVGKENGEKEVICKSKNDLFYALIADNVLGDVLNEIEIVWYNT